MTFLAPPAPPAYVVSVEDCLADRAASQGADGRIVEESIRQALEHYHDRVQWLIEAEADEELQLSPVRLPNIGSMRVTFRHGSGLRVAPYNFDDE